MIGDEHNLHESSHAQTLVVGDRAGRPEHSPEPCEFLLDYAAGVLTIISEDGERWSLDAAELVASEPIRAALNDTLGLREAA